MSQQPKWKLELVGGDVDWLVYGGHFVYIDETGVYPPECEWLETPIEVDDSDSYLCKWTVYRFILEQCTYIDGILSDNRYHPDDPVWFYDRDSFARIAHSVGLSPEAFALMFCSPYIGERLEAYREIYEYHGWDNADDTPLYLNQWEVETRYRALIKRELGLTDDTPDLICADVCAEKDRFHEESIFRLAEVHMDPNANLKEQLELARELVEMENKDLPRHGADVRRLAELVESLHDWISKGGFLPKRWTRKSK